MRELQKEFFRQNRNTVSQLERARLVSESKKLESQVDAAVEGILKPEQPRLFS